MTAVGVVGVVGVVVSSRADLVFFLQSFVATLRSPRSRDALVIRRDTIVYVTRHDTRGDSDALRAQTSLHCVIKTQ